MGLVPPRQPTLLGSASHPGPRSKRLDSRRQWFSRQGQTTVERFRTPDAQDVAASDRRHHVFVRLMSVEGFSPSQIVVFRYLLAGKRKRNKQCNA